MTKEEVIITAATWWADKLRKRQPHSNGDNSASSIFACIFADIGMKNVTEDQYNVFERALAVGIEDQYKKYLENLNFPNIYVGCDYDPCSVLAEAADKAGIPTLNFPYKTHMQITKNEVFVADGYGKPYVAI